MEGDVRGGCRCCAVTPPEAWWRAADFVEIASRAGQIGQRAPKGGRRRETVMVLWVFNDVEVDPDRFELRDGEPMAVEPQVFDLLVYLTRTATES